MDIDKFFKDSEELVKMGLLTWDDVYKEIDEQLQLMDDEELNSRAENEFGREYYEELYADERMSNRNE